MPRRGEADALCHATYETHEGPTVCSRRGEHLYHYSNYAGVEWTWL